MFCLLSEDVQGCDRAGGDILERGLFLYHLLLNSPFDYMRLRSRSVHVSFVGYRRKAKEMRKTRNEKERKHYTF